MKTIWVLMLIIPVTSFFLIFALWIFRRRQYKSFSERIRGGIYVRYGREEVEISIVPVEASRELNFSVRQEVHLEATYETPEPVLLGASAPARVCPGDEFTARFVAYVKELEKEIKDQLEKQSPRAIQHLGIKHCRWQLGTRVNVRLYGNYIAVACPEEEFTWEGDSSRIEFDVTVSPDAPETTTVLKFDILIAEITIAKLRLDLEINSTAAAAAGINIAKAEPAKTAFASYASKDRYRVLDRVAEIERNGVDVFLDCLSIHPGQNWEWMIEKQIIHTDLFLLFWSKHAKESEWVTWEWKMALKHKGLFGIDLHPLDPVFEAEPPEELRSLHFGDPIMLVRTAYKQHDEILQRMTRSRD